MKHILYFLLFSQVAQAQQSRFHEGETIYVWALSGLNMRKLPNAKSEKIAALPYGTKVVVQPNIGMVVAHEVEEFKDFKVKGVWLLVKYGDKEGFVFDGYMSRLVAPVNLEKNTKDKAFDILLSYLEKQIGRTGKDIYKITSKGKKVKISESNFKKEEYDLSVDEEIVVSYKNGITHSFGHNEKAYLAVVEFPSFTLYEGYIITKVIYKNYKINYDKIKKEFSTEDAWNAGCEHIFSIKNKNLFISVQCSC